MVGLALAGLTQRKNKKDLEIIRGSQIDRAEGITGGGGPFYLGQHQRLLG